MIELEDIAITARVSTSAIGAGRAANAEALRTGTSGLARCTLPGVTVPCHTGAVAGLDALTFPEALTAWDNRATRLCLSALQADGFDDRVREAVARYGAGRVALVIGTSTSGVDRLEEVYRARDGVGDTPLAPDYVLRHHNDHHAVSGFLYALFGLGGPGHTVSTACSSGAKAIVDAAHLIQLGLADAVLTGGIDALCLTSVHGFDALELVSRAPCRPFDAKRDGLSIGEGAGFLLLERGGEGPRLAGYGESSDANNMSTPPEDGAGAQAAMREALDRAGLAPAAIAFVKLHGTATPSNDSAEGAAVAHVFGPATPAVSLKGLIGHTLGAAGALEAVMALDALDAGLCPGTTGLEEPDTTIPIAVSPEPVPITARHVLCNAFGFGGSNCALVLAA